MAMARNYNKYRIYGIKVKIIPKEFFPTAAGDKSVRGIHIGTFPDYDQAAVNGLLGNNAEKDYFSQP